MIFNKSYQLTKTHLKSKKVLMPALFQVCCYLQCSLFLLLLHLVPPQPVPVVAGKTVDDNRDRKSEDEDASKSAEPSNEPPQECLGINIISYGGNGHQAPPEGLHKGPGVARMAPNMFPLVPAIGR